MTFPFAQLLANSLIIGSIYALVASGFSLIYSANRFLHVAHGVAVVASGYVLYTVFILLGIPLTPSILLTILFAGGLGYAMHRLLYDQLRNRQASNVILLLASIGLLILVENIILAVYGADVKSFSVQTQVLNILGANITVLQLIIILVSFGLFIGLYLYMNKTTTGRNIRAVADNPELATIMGINASHVQALTFVIGSALAAVAGILIGMEQNLTPSMGTNLIVKGFSGAVIGGITSVPASIAGSIFVGLAENFGIWWLPSGWKDAITFGLLFLFLLFKPSGLFGTDKGVRK